MYYLFGSENSLDYDVVVIVDNISPTIDINHQVCKDYNFILSKIYTDKPLNCNIATFKDGYITDCFKGTYCELNNAIFHTYNLHIQEHPLLIKNPIERDRHEKIKRVVRGILSFYSRSSIRSEIKHALRNNLAIRIPVVEKIDMSIYYEFKGKKEQYNDIMKVLAFQYGQVFSLYDGFEQDSYTKNGIIKNYPDLEPFLTRKGIYDLNILEYYKKRLVQLAKTEMLNMSTLFETITPN